VFDVGHGSDDDGDGYPDWVDANDDGEISTSELKKYVAHTTSTGRSIGERISDSVGWINEYKNAIQAFFGNPIGYLRARVIPIAVGVIAAIVQPFIDVFELLFGGSKPQEFAAEGEVWGLADIPAAFGELLGGLLGSLSGLPFSVSADLIDAVTVSTPGPFDGVIAFVGVAVLGVLAARYGPLLLRSGLEAIPVIGGPLATLLGGAK
jgi:hypothetical protein